MAHAACYSGCEHLNWFKYKWMQSTRDVHENVYKNASLLLSYIIYPTTLFIEFIKA